MQVREIVQKQSYPVSTTLLPLFENRKPVSRDYCLEMDDVDSSAILELHVTS